MRFARESEIFVKGYIICSIKGFYLDGAYHVTGNPFFHLPFEFPFYVVITLMSK